MFKKEFLKAVAERAIKTFIQVIGSATGLDAMNFLNIDVTVSLKLALGAALLSIITSFGSSKIGNNGPSLVGEFVDAVLPIVQKTFVSAGLAPTDGETAKMKAAKAPVKKKAVSKK
jgi:hypothetical protein